MITKLGRKYKGYFWDQNYGYGTKQHLKSIKSLMKIIAGVDEVGRGSLIGPVYAAAVILKKSINKKLLKDSKKLNKNKREILSKSIKSIFPTPVIAKY